MKPELLLSYACRLAAMVGILCSSEPTFAQSSPRLLPFQGRVTDAEGGALPDGPRVIRFRISESPVDNTFKWAGELHRTTVNGGLINLVLGSRTPLEGVDFGKQLFLEVTVDANGDGAVTELDPPMLPRQAILPALFAHEAENSRKLLGYDWSSLFGAAGTNPATARLSGERIEEGSLPASRIEEGGITAGKLADGQIGLKKLVSPQVGQDVGIGGLAVSQPMIGEVGIDSQTYQKAGSLEVAIETTGRPVEVFLGGDAAAGFSYLSATYKGSSGNSFSQVKVVRDQNTVQEFYLGHPGAIPVFYPPGCIRLIDTPPAGRHVYHIEASVVYNANTLLQFRGVRLFAREL